MKRKNQYTVYLLEEKFKKVKGEPNRTFEKIFLEKEKRWEDYKECISLLKDIDKSLENIKRNRGE